MTKKTKQYLLLITFAIGLFAALTNFDVVLSIANKIFNLFLPLIVGLVIAFILSVPMKGFENLITKIFSKTKYKPKGKTLNIIGFVLTIISVTFTLFIVFRLALPEIIASVQTIIDTIIKKWPKWMNILNEYNIDTKQLSNVMSNIDLASLATKLTGGAEIFIGSIFNISVSIVSGVITTLIAIVISVYTLLSREALARQTKKLIYACTKNSIADKICYIAKRTQDIFTKFLSGQCVEAFILGILMFLAFTIFRLPYAGLIGVLAGVCTFVPYVGAFVAFSVGTFLVLISDPSKVIITIIVYLVVQFIESQFIYPHVVGNSVGLSPLLTLVAALIGGDLFGLFGIIFFIPFTAVIYSLLSEFINERIKKKQIVIDKKTEV